MDLSFISNPLGQLIMWILSIFVGGVITYLASKRYYVRASRDLEKEIQILKKNNLALIAYIQNVLGTDLSRNRLDEEGNPTITDVTIRCQGYANISQFGQASFNSGKERVTHEH